MYLYIFKFSIDFVKIKSILLSCFGPLSQFINFNLTLLRPFLLSLIFNIKDQATTKGIKPPTLESTFRIYYQLFS